MIIKSVKNFLKKHFYILKVWDKFTPSVQIQQVQLFHYYQERNHNKLLPKFNEVGFKVFSQFEEDGKLLYIFSIIGMGNKTFVDLGSNDGLNSNCANLAINFQWKGLFVDGDKTVIERGKKFYKKYPDFWSHKPVFLHSFITKENVNELLKNNHITNEIELLSIDIDGNDYWIWEAIEVISPKVVIIESQVAFGLENVVVPYKEDFSTDLANHYYCGASSQALTNLGKRKGYRLVGTNDYGNNLFFIKNGLAEGELPEVTVASTLTHPFATEKFHHFEALKNKKFIQG